MARRKNTIINIRSAFREREGICNLQHEVESVLDKKLRTYLHNQAETEISIIVGKGLNSTSYIDGKNPLRYYVENYLNKMQIRYKNGNYFNGQEGVLIVYL